MYNAPKNSPFLTQTEKKLHYDRHIRDNPQHEQEPMLDFKVYQPKQRKKREPDYIYPPHIAESAYVPNPYDMSFMDHLRYNYEVVRPLVKSYNINIGDFRGKLPHMSVVEDVLPLKNVSATFTSIDNRNMLNDFIRSILFPSGDGQDMEMTNSSGPIYTGGTHNLANDIRFSDLMTRIKLLELNPYYGENPGANPFVSDPFGFRIYRSCYPIKYDSHGIGGISSCARDSVGVNIRLYRLTEDSYWANKNKEPLMYNKDEWRDILFYLFVKNDLIKPKMSPNFAMIYGYFVALDSRIIYDTLHRRDVYTVTSYDKIPNMINPIVPDPDAYYGKSIVALTEAYNYNMLRWTTKDYKAAGNIPYMTNHGFYPPTVWYSVLFQLMSALHCMQKKGIIITNIDPLTNVFIKDTSANGSSTNYWKYKIDGIDYYVPNTGYVVLIDSNFKDPQMQVPYNKLRGAVVGDPEGDEEDILHDTFDMFMRVINPDVFNERFVANGGNKPPDAILNLLARIQHDAVTSNDKVISHYIRKYMTMYMHNRIGTMLTDTERNNVQIGGPKNFNKGQIVVYTDGEGANRFALFINKIEENDGPDRTALVLTKYNSQCNALVEQEVPNHSLNEYPMSEPLRQKTTPDSANLEESNLLETYIQ